MAQTVDRKMVRSWTEELEAVGESPLGAFRPLRSAPAGPRLSAWFAL